MPSRASVFTLLSLRPLPVPPMATTASAVSSLSAASSVVPWVIAEPPSASIALAMSAAALYRDTTNPLGSWGSGVVLAARARTGHLGAGSAGRSGCTHRRHPA